MIVQLTSRTEFISESQTRIGVVHHYKSYKQRNHELPRANSKMAGLRLFYNKITSMPPNSIYDTICNMKYPKQ